MRILQFVLLSSTVPKTQKSTKLKVEHSLLADWASRTMMAGRKETKKVVVGEAMSVEVPEIEVSAEIDIDVDDGMEGEGEVYDRCIGLAVRVALGDATADDLRSNESDTPPLMPISSPIAKPKADFSAC